MKSPTRANSALPVWQSALLTQGCQVHSGGQIFSLELLPVGDRIVGTPTISGWMAPFHLVVTVGQPVTITWDHELSRYLVTTPEQRLAA
jgi:hypothetical protein